MLHIVYHPKYLKYRFGPHHPFWPERATEFIKLLDKKEVRYKLHEPKKTNDEELLLVHSEEYLKRVKQLAITQGELSPDTPVNLQILEAAYYYTGGTILASTLALEGKLVVNLLGGLHHAGIHDSSGFCIFNDHAVAIRKLQKEKKIKKAFVFDIDVHAGQGTQEIFYEDPSVFTLSIHQDPRTIYPGTGFPNQIGIGKGKGFNLNINLPPGSGEPEFTQAILQGLSLQDKFKPDITFLVFGADTYEQDPLANINLELNSYHNIGTLLKTIKPLCPLFAGGYSRKVPIIWLEFLQGLGMVGNKKPRID